MGKFFELLDSLIGKINSSVKTEAQNLSPDQKVQARGNIDAASKEEVDELKTSVSEGKALIASAVTDKGIETADDATFETMAANIGRITVGEGGASFEVSDDGNGNVSIANAVVIDNDGALTIALAVNTNETNGRVTVGG